MDLSNDQDSQLRLATVTTPGLLGSLRWCRMGPLLVRPRPLMTMLPRLAAGSPSLRELPAFAVAKRDYTLFEFIHISTHTPTPPKKPQPTKKQLMHQAIKLFQYIFKKGLN